MSFCRDSQSTWASSWIFNVGIFVMESLVQANHIKYQKNLAHRAKSMKFGMKVLKTKKKILILNPSENCIERCHNDVIIAKFDVIVTSGLCILLGPRIKLLSLVLGTFIPKIMLLAQCARFFYMTEIKVNHTSSISGR